VIADLLASVLVLGGTGTLAFGGWWWWLREQRLQRRDARQVALERERTEQLRLQLQAKVRMQESADRIYFDLLPSTDQPRQVE
jgi:hypothetical protein